METAPKEWDWSFYNPELVDYRGTPITSPYFQGIEAVQQYVYDVLNERRHASENEQYVCSRFIKDCSRDDLTLNTELFAFILVIANSMRHSKGPIAGSNILLLPWMQFNLLNTFCWTYNDNAAPELQGQRRFQTSFTFVARGNAKTQLAAVVAVVSMLITQNGSPIVTTSASTRKQAAIAFEEIKSQIATTNSKFIKKRFKPLSNEIRITGGGCIMPTSSEAGTLDGLRIVTGIVDELHTHPDSKVSDVIQSGTASSKDPLIYIITTAGTSTTSYCKEVYDYCCSVASGTREDDRYFVQLFEADRDLEADDEKGWEMANPSIDHAVSRTTLRANYNKARSSPAAMAAFETKHLNRWFEFAESGYMDSVLVENIRGEIPTDLNKLDCYVGVDLAAISDLSTVAAIFVDSYAGKYYVKTKSFLASAAYDQIDPKFKSLYYQALANGTLEINDGVVTDEQVIHEYIESLYSKYEVRELGIDAAAGGHRFSEQHKSMYGGEFLAVSQGYGLSDAAVRLLRFAHDGTITIDQNDPLIKWALLNARVTQGEYGDIKVVRPKNSDKLKIDPCVATLIGLSLVPAVNQSVGIR